MIRVLVVADSGDVMQRVTATLCQIDRVDIVAYASGRTPVDQVVRAVGPDVVLLDEMCWPGLALTRLAEVREACPLAVVIGLVERPDDSWIVEGLKAGAGAVVPRDLEPETLQLVLGEALAVQAPKPLLHHERRAA
jgi:DNA-binding NarL/FixJ family response regulator